MNFLNVLILLTLGLQIETTQEMDNNVSNNKTDITRNVENNISYEKGILRKKLNYQLVHGQKGKFILRFPDKVEQDLNVKIYDIIGNLIQKDTFSSGGANEKEYDFSEFDTKIYVVKVSNQAEDVVKKINI